MDHQPRRLPVFEPVDRSYISEPLAERGKVSINGMVQNVLKVLRFSVKD